MPRPGLCAAWLRALALAPLPRPLARAGPAPAAGPCGCRDGAEHWARFRGAAAAAFAPGLDRRLFAGPGHWEYDWLADFPCPGLGGGWKGALALSDCAAGVLLLHVACAQGLLLRLQYEEAQEHMVRALWALPFAAVCLEADAGPVWPVKAADVYQNYVRFYRAVSYYEPSWQLLEDLLWRPSARVCTGDHECRADAGERCLGHWCARAGGEVDCPAGEVCTELRSPSGGDCTLILRPACVVGGGLEAYHPRGEALPSSHQRMIKACSEMGTTLYPLRWSSTPFRRQASGDAAGPEAALAASALVLPVTVKLRSPWHMLHSLVPAFAQAWLDDRYGLLERRGDISLFVVDQDLDKDRHIWDAALGPERDGGRLGPFGEFLRLVSRRPYELLADVAGPRCFGHVVWGHEHMLYSGGGWVNSTHVQAFTASARSMLGPRNGKASQERRLLLTERGRNSSWGRWIDNFAAVRLEAERWAAGSGVVDRVEVSDFAQLPLAEQLGQAAGLRILFGAHGDGLTWGAFMEPGGAVLEVVPARRQGFQVCEEGANRNPRGIFGGVARLAGQAHVCFVSPESKVLPFESFEKDAWQWGWRQMNIHVDLEKLVQFLGVAAALVEDAAPS